MRILLIPIITIFLIVSCKDNDVQNQQLKKTTINSNDIPVKSIINFNSNPLGQKYKTLISEKYNSHDINFALHYVVITWGCGSGCVTGVMVDSRDGCIYALPQDKEWGGNGTYIKTTKNSNILTSVLAIQSPEGKIRETEKFWIWSAQNNKWNLQ